MAIYKHGRGFQLGTTENKSSEWPEQDVNPGPLDCELDALTTQQHCFLILLSLSLSLLFVILRFSPHEIPFALPSCAGHTSNLYSYVHVSTVITVLLKGFKNPDLKLLGNVLIHNNNVENVMSTYCSIVASLIY